MMRDSTASRNALNLSTAAFALSIRVAIDCAFVIDVSSSRRSLSAVVSTLCERRFLANSEPGTQAVTCPARRFDEICEVSKCRVCIQQFPDDIAQSVERKRLSTASRSKTKFIHL